MGSETKQLLDGLYPWQNAEAENAGSAAAALLDSMQQKLLASNTAKTDFVAGQGPALLAAAGALANRFSAGGRLFTMGNGGSACDAAHLAVEFGHPVTAGRPALPAQHLGADTAMLTALANDLGAEHLYARQVAALARPGDALVGLSTSGNSANLAAAFARASTLGLCTIALLGSGGGALASDPSVQHRLIVPSDSVHRIQETQVLIYHLLWDLVHTLLANSGR